MINALNNMVRKMDVWDVGLTKLAVLAAAIIIVKIWPQLLDFNYSVLIVLVVVLVIRPVYTIWFRK